MQGGLAFSVFTQAASAIGGLPFACAWHGSEQDMKVFGSCMDDSGALRVKLALQLPSCKLWTRPALLCSRLLHTTWRLQAMWRNMV